MNRPLVSIITPCYNGAATVGRMIESVLAQTYSVLEYILVNDGSTDNSEEVVLSYRDQLETKGIRFVYIKQKNGGLAAAINAGLKVFTGKYLCWADADDFYDPTSIEKRVRWMEEHPEYGVVTSDAYIVNDGDLEHPIQKVSSGCTNNTDENQFWHLLDADSIFCAGSHMMRAECFLRCYSDRQIYPARRGQNWQMLLPVYYHYKRYFMNEPLYYIVSYPQSMSKDPTMEAILYRCDEHEEIIKNTLAVIDMNAADARKAESIVRLNYVRKRLRIAFSFGLGDVAKKQLACLKSTGDATLRDRVLCFGAKHPWFRKLLRR